MWNHQNPTSPRYSNTHETQANDLKSNLMKRIETFKEEVDKYLKEIQENTIKQVESLRERMDKYKEIQQKYNQTGEGNGKTVQDQIRSNKKNIS